MTNYAKEVFAHRVLLYKQSAKKEPYLILQEDEQVFHTEYKNSSIRLARRDDLGLHLYNSFPGNDYAVVSRVDEDAETWHVAIRTEKAEMMWIIRFDWDKQRLVSTLFMVKGKKEHLPDRDQYLTAMLRVLKEIPAYRLYFLTGTVYEQIEER